MTEVRTLGPAERFQNFLGSFQTEEKEYKYRQRRLKEERKRTLYLAHAKFVLIEGFCQKSLWNKLKMN